MLAGVFPIRAVADLTDVGILSAFIVVCAAVALFRCTRPETPLVPPGLQAVRPRIRVLSSLFPIWQLPWETWFRLGVWCSSGSPSCTAPSTRC